MEGFNLDKLWCELDRASEHMIELLNDDSIKEVQEAYELLTGIINQGNFSAAQVLLIASTMGSESVEQLVKEAEENIERPTLRVIKGGK